MRKGAMLVGYARVSKADDRDTTAQVKALRKAGCKRIFEEKASGGRWDRPQLHKALEQLQEGDVLVVWKLDRLSRSLKDLLHIMERIVMWRSCWPSGTCTPITATIDFLVSAKRDAAAAERFLAKARSGANHPAPRVINTDKHAGYPPAIVQLKAEAALERNCRHRPVQYLNNVLEQDHRAIKRGLTPASIFARFGELGVRSPATRRSI